MPTTRKTLSNIVFQNFEQPPWPSFVKPFHDELFSSWLLRLSRNHLLRLYSFCSSYFPGVELWNRDIDKFLPDTIKETIIKKSILKGSDIENMLLSYLYSKVYLSGLEGRNFWFTPFSIYEHRSRNRTTLSICTSCLAKDGTNPYYRKHWRLSIQTICNSCGVDMIDKCPSCGLQINYLIAEKGRKSQIPIFPITYCWKCLFDLTQYQAKKATPDQLSMQLELQQSIDTGFEKTHSQQYSHLYFTVLKKIISLFNKQNIEQLIKFQKLICDNTGLAFSPPLNGRTNPFELMSVEHRRDLTYKAFWVLEDWPFRFREITVKAGLRSKYFTDDFSDCPYWFYNELTNIRLVFSEWRKYYPGYTYSSFNELATWHVSKIKRRNNKS